MIIQIVPSENFERAEARKLLKDIQNQGIPAEPGGTYHRRSVEELPPLVQLVITGVVGGFIGAIGEDAWRLVKLAIERVFESRSQGEQPQVLLAIESENGTSILWNIDPGVDFHAQLDSALERLQEIGEPADLWYDERLEKWQTLDERLSRHK